MLSRMLSVCLSALSLVSCSAHRMPVKPSPPQLREPVALPDGGVCLFRDDASALMVYIYQLEQGYAPQAE